MDRVKHLVRILRSSHPIELGNLPDPRVRVGQVNPIGLKLDPTITLIDIIDKVIEFITILDI